MRFRYAVGTAVAMLGLCLQSAPALAGFEFNNERWDGASELVQVARQALGKARVVVTNDLSWDGLSPRDGVLILYPTVNLNFSDVSAFLSAGGRVALTDDFGLGDRLLERFHIQRGKAAVAPNEVVAGNPKLQVARPVVSVDDKGRRVRHPTVQGVERVFTNHPTTLLPNPGVELTPVLSIDRKDGDAANLAIIGVIGDARQCGLEGSTPKPSQKCGRLFAISDASIFINLMLNFDGNRRFAEGLTGYLLEDDAWGAREGKLFILSGEFSQTGHFGGNNSASRSLENALNALRDALRALERRGLPRNAALVLCAALLALIAWYSWKTGGTHFRSRRPKYALPVPMVSLGGHAGRLAVLGADTTRPEVVLLDLKQSLETFMAHHLTLDGRPAFREIIKELLRRRDVPRRLREELIALADLIERAEQALVRSKTIRVSEDKLDQVQRTVAELQKMLNDKRGPHVERP